MGYNPIFWNILTEIHCKRNRDAKALLVYISQANRSNIGLTITIVFISLSSPPGYGTTADKWNVLAWWKRVVDSYYMAFISSSSVIDPFVANHAGLLHLQNDCALRDSKSMAKIVAHSSSNSALTDSHRYYDDCYPVLEDCAKPYRLLYGGGNNVDQGSTDYSPTILNWFLKRCIQCPLVNDFLPFQLAFLLSTSPHI